MAAGGDERVSSARRIKHQSLLKHHIMKHRIFLEREILTLGRNKHRSHALVLYVTRNEVTDYKPVLCTTLHATYDQTGTSDRRTRKLEVENQCVLGGWYISFIRVCSFFHLCHSRVIVIWICEFLMAYFLSYESNTRTELQIRDIKNLRRKDGKEGRKEEGKFNSGMS